MHPRLQGRRVNVGPQGLGHAPLGRAFVRARAARAEVVSTGLDAAARLGQSHAKDPQVVHSGPQRRHEGQADGDEVAHEPEVLLARATKSGIPICPQTMQVTVD